MDRLILPVDQYADLASALAERVYVHQLASKSRLWRILHYRLVQRATAQVEMARAERLVHAAMRAANLDPAVAYGLDPSTHSVVRQDSVA